MRDDRHLWTPPVALHDGFNLGGARLVEIALSRQTMISGPGARKAGDIGWPEVVGRATYRITLRRDRAIEVGGDVRPEGWDSTKGAAVSDVSDATRVFDLSGAQAFDILKRGTEISLDQPSASVVRLLFGIEVWLYRIKDERTFRLHVAHALGEALVGHLKAAAAAQKS